MSSIKRIYHKELLQILRIAAKDQKILDDFLVDLLTPAELRDIAVRWQIVKQLRSGVPQRRIAKRLEVSIAKITRGSRTLSNGKGGFNQLLNRTR